MAYPVTSDENFSISVVIGVNHYWQFIQDHVVRGDGPTAVQSRLGYLFLGSLPLPRPASTTNLHISIFSCTTEDATDTSFWQVESTGTTQVAKTLDSDFLQDHQSTKITVQSDGVYSLKFPWKDSHPPLPLNYTVCYRRTRSMVYQLAKTPKLLNIYDTIIREQKTTGFIEKVNDNCKRDSVHYLPHYPV